MMHSITTKHQEFNFNNSSFLNAPKLLSVSLEMSAAIVQTHFNVTVLKNMFEQMRVDIQFVIFCSLIAYIY